MARKNVVKLKSRAYQKAKKLGLSPKWPMNKAEYEALLERMVDSPFQEKSNRSELYHRAKALGWETQWNKSTTKDLAKYIEKHGRRPTRRPTPITRVLLTGTTRDAMFAETLDALTPFIGRSLLISNTANNKKYEIPAVSSVKELRNALDIINGKGFFTEGNDYNNIIDTETEVVYLSIRPISIIRGSPVGRKQDFSRSQGPMSVETHCLLGPIYNKFQSLLDKASSKSHIYNLKSKLKSITGIYDSYPEPNHGVPESDCQGISNKLEISLEFHNIIGTDPVIIRPANRRSYNCFRYCNSSIDHLSIMGPNNPGFTFMEFVTVSGDEFYKHKDSSDMVVEFSEFKIGTENGFYELDDERVPFIEEFKSNSSILELDIDTLEYDMIYHAYTQTGRWINPDISNETPENGVLQLDQKKSYLNYVENSNGYYCGMPGVYLGIFKYSTEEILAFTRTRRHSVTTCKSPKGNCTHAPYTFILRGKFSNVKHLPNYLSCILNLTTLTSPLLNYLLSAYPTLIFDTHYAMKFESLEHIKYPKNSDTVRVGNTLDGWKEIDEVIDGKKSGTSIYSLLVGLIGGMYPVSSKRIERQTESTANLISDFARPYDNIKVYTVASSDSDFDDNGKPLVDITIKNYKTKTSTHRHVSAFICNYQTIGMLSQLQTMDPRDIYAIQTDGIFYYNTHCPHKSGYIHNASFGFRSKPVESSPRKNIQSTEGLFAPHRISHKKPEYLMTRSYSRTNLVCGAGGSGKTHTLLTSLPKYQTIYAAPSNKLVSSKKEEYKLPYAVTIASLMGDGCQPFDFERHGISYIIIDEVTMRDNNDIKRIIKRFSSKSEGNACTLIFAGDIDSETGYQYQLPSVKNSNGDIDLSLFEKVYSVERSEHSRTSDPKLLKLLDELRGSLTVSSSIETLQTFINPISPYDIDPSNDDVILSSHSSCLKCGNKTCDHEYEISRNTSQFYDEYFPERNNYICTPKKVKNVIYDGKCYYRGDIIWNAPSVPNPNHFQRKSSYTIHLFQGETISPPAKLYIDIAHLFNSRQIYTAVSRARTFDQITIIDSTC